MGKLAVGKPAPAVHICPTVEVDRITFRRPVSVGDLLSMRSTVTHTWPSKQDPGKVRNSPGRQMRAFVAASTEPLLFAPPSSA